MQKDIFPFFIHETLGFPLALFLENPEIFWERVKIPLFLGEPVEHLSPIV
jgi:hypothetical protein